MKQFTNRHRGFQSSFMIAGALDLAWSPTSGPHLASVSINQAGRGLKTNGMRLSNFTPEHRATLVFLDFIKS